MSGSFAERKPEMTFAEIGKRLGISQSRARKIYSNALWKLINNHELSQVAASGDIADRVMRERGL